MSFATLLYAACNATDPQQSGFSLLAGSGIAHGGLCVTYDAVVGLNAPLELRPCSNMSSQQWAYSNNAFSSTDETLSLQWSGQEHGACTSNPPSLGQGCIIGAWHTAVPTTWNNAFLLDSPVPGMIQAQFASSGGLTPSGLCVSVSQPPAPPTPTADVLAWSRREIMCLYDIDMCTYVGSQGCDCSAPPPPADAWAPTALDTDSWIAAGVSAGCQIHILVAKHMCGFLSWASTSASALGYNYSTAYSSTPVDAVDAFVKSARKASQRIGMYYSLTNNARTKTCNGNILPNSAAGQISVTPAQYDEIVRGHLTELWGNYGELDETWFDGGFVASQKTWIPALLSTLQPHAVAFNGETLSPNPTRWIGTESGYAPVETWSTCDYSDNGSGGGSPESPTWFPAETDFTVLASDTWFFDNVHDVRPPAELRAMYEASVGRNTQMLIGLAIPPNGTVAGTAQAQALSTLGAYISGCFGSPIAQTSGTGLTFSVMPSAAVTIDRVTIAEDQTTGQRVRAWNVSAMLANGTTVSVGAGLSVGNKRIIAFPELSAVSMVTLTIAEAIATPVIRMFAIYGGCNALAKELDK